MPFGIELTTRHVAALLVGWLLASFFERGARRWLIIPRAYLAAYYVFAACFPGLLPLAVAHFMARAGLIAVALSEAVFVLTMPPRESIAHRLFDLIMERWQWTLRQLRRG